MCLEKITRLEFDPEEEVEAYKIFVIDKKMGEEVYPLYNYIVPLSIKKWIKDKVDVYIAIGDKKSYPCGFHAFLSYNDALVYFNSRLEMYGAEFITLRKVKMKRVVAEGTQNLFCKYFLKTVVAKEMFITDEEA